MPAEFDRLRAMPGSRIRTIKPNASTYIHIVYGPHGESARGEVKKVKSGTKPGPGNADRSHA